MSTKNNSLFVSAAITVFVVSCLVIFNLFFNDDVEVQVVAAQQSFGSEQETLEHAALMRNNHPDLMKHKRDLTMREGLRSEDNSLKQCVNCHAAKDEQGSYVSVGAEGQFCSSCHQVMAVKPDCFECHASTPSKDWLSLVFKESY